MAEETAEQKEARELDTLGHKLRNKGLPEEQVLAMVAAKKAENAAETKRQADIKARVDAKRALRNRPKLWRNPIGGRSVEDIDADAAVGNLCDGGARTVDQREFAREFMMTHSLINKQPGKGKIKPAAKEPRSRRSSLPPSRAASVAEVMPPTIATAPKTASPMRSRSQSVSSHYDDRPPPVLPHYSLGSPDSRAYSQVLIETQPLSKSVVLHMPMHIPLHDPDAGPDKRPSPYSIKCIMDNAAVLVKYKKANAIVPRRGLDEGPKEKTGYLSFEDIKSLVWGTPHQEFSDWFIRKGKDEKVNNRVSSLNLMNLNKLLHESSGIPMRQLSEGLCPIGSPAWPSPSYSPDASPVHGSRFSPTQKGFGMSQLSLDGGRSSKQSFSAPTVGSRGRRTLTSPEQLKMNYEQLYDHRGEPIRRPLWQPGQTRAYIDWEQPPSPVQVWSGAQSRWEAQRRDADKFHKDLFECTHKCKHKHVIRPDLKMVFCCHHGTFPHGNHPHTSFNAQA